MYDQTKIFETRNAHQVVLSQSLHKHRIPFQFSYKGITFVKYDCLLLNNDAYYDNKMLIILQHHIKFPIIHFFSTLTGRFWQPF